LIRASTNFHSKIKDVDARDKPGHDEESVSASTGAGYLLPGREALLGAERLTALKLVGGLKRALHAAPRAESRTLCFLLSRFGSAWRQAILPPQAGVTNKGGI
jgi:hypothetical protein